jgi:hypothetical protein
MNDSDQIRDLLRRARDLEQRAEALREQARRLIAQELEGMYSRSTAS